MVLRLPVAGSSTAARFSAPITVCTASLALRVFPEIVLKEVKGRSEAAMSSRKNLDVRQRIPKDEHKHSLGVRLLEAATSLSGALVKSSLVIDSDAFFTYWAQRLCNDYKMWTRVARRAPWHVDKWRRKGRDWLGEEGCLKAL